MGTSSAEPIPLEPDPGTSHQRSLSSSQDQVQTVQPASQSQGSLSSSSTAVPKYFDRVRPTWSVRRYERKTILEPPYFPEEDLKLDPITTSFIDDDEPKDWNRLVHPEGALYWVFEHQQGGKIMPVYTDAHLCDKNTCQEVEKFRDAILSKIDPTLMPSEWELVLDLGDEYPQGYVCYYYFVNHSNRTLFWLHEFDLKPILNKLEQIKSKRRIQQALEHCYWSHWEMFPHDREVPEKLLKELVGIMMHAGLDDMTSSASTSVYSGEELQKYISHVNQIKFVGRDGGYSACVVGRLMVFLVLGRYVHFYGQREARLSNDQSIFGGKGKRRTWLIRSTSLLLFFTPEVHLKELNTVYTDFIVSKHKWNKFICKVQNEWRELIRIGTVFLTANVAFLAIPSVDSMSNGSGPSIPAGTATSGGFVRNPAQVTSFMSVIFSMGCMVTGQLLLRHHTIRTHDSADEVDSYLRRYHDKDRGLETLAILYSLPQSLLLWAVASFFVAFIFVTLVDSKGKWQRYPTAVATFIFIALLLWCVWATWEGREKCIQWIRGFMGRTSAPNRGRHIPLRPPEETVQFQSIRLGPGPPKLSDH